MRESQYEHTQSRIGATPWDRPDLYLENSGLFGIKNVTTPYLTIHNELDGAVPQFQGIEYITAMRRLGKEAYLFAFDGEEHELARARAAEVLDGPPRRVVRLLAQGRAAPGVDERRRLPAPRRARRAPAYGEPD